MDPTYAELWHYRNVQKMCVELKKQGLGDSELTRIQLEQLELLLHSN